MKTLFPVTLATTGAIVGLTLAHPVLGLVGAVLASVLALRSQGPGPDRLEALQGEVDTLVGERDRMEAVLEGMQEAVFGLDAEGRLTGANGAGLRLLGRTTAPIGEALGIVEPALAAAAAADEGSHRVALPGAQHYMARVTRLRSGPGRVMVLLDVTRLRQLEQIRRDFVANVSHELRTPVSVIRANAETLRDGALADPIRARTFLDALMRNAERLSDLVADLLDISRIEAGRYQVEPVQVMVVDTAVVAFELVEPLALARNTTVDFDLSEGLLACADPKALSQVLTNLLENAIKYTPEGSTVLLTGCREGDVVRLEVRDDGPGIPVDQHERVFERFYRVDAGRAKEDGGTGLGLAIVKHLVGAMGGSVGVHPNTPQGTVFWVCLPAVQAQTAA